MKEIIDCEWIIDDTKLLIVNGFFMIGDCWLWMDYLRYKIVDLSGLFTIQNCWLWVDYLLYKIVDCEWIIYDTKLLIVNQAKKMPSLNGKEHLESHHMYFLRVLVLDALSLENQAVFGFELLCLESWECWPKHVAALLTFSKPALVM